MAKLSNEQMIQLAIQVVLIIAAVNWALIAHGQQDLVTMVTKDPEIQKYIRTAFGVVAAYQAFLLSRRFTA